MDNNNNEFDVDIRRVALERPRGGRIGKAGYKRVVDKTRVSPISGDGDCVTNEDICTDADNCTTPEYTCPADWTTPEYTCPADWTTPEYTCISTNDTCD